ncbi:MAG: hypothetical protein DMF64_03380 [Acidobacteria bacterium]|nr:MAG: hypothetical protein DMF64_03380 [Acidobacteriota bacterium]
MRPSRTLGFAFLIISLTLCAALTPAQQNQITAPQQSTLAPSPTPTQFAKKLNVIVLDKKGAPVNDLRQEDFQVSEDGTPQTITSFAHAAAPVSYALVMDNSGSLREQIKQIARIGVAVTAGNRADDETAILRFISRDTIELIQTLTADQAQFEGALDNLYAQGGQTAIIDAVYLSGAYVMAQGQRGENRHRALVLVTDGEDRASFYKLNDLLRYLRWADVQVFSIGLVQELDKQGGLISSGSREKAERLLNTLAEETGGRVFYPKKLEQLRDAVDAIRHDLHTQYVISYTPTNQTTDDTLRKVQIKLVERPGTEKRTIIVRSDYIVTPPPPANPKSGAPRIKTKPWNVPAH